MDLLLCLPCRQQQRTCSFSLCKRTWWQPGTMKSVGVLPGFPPRRQDRVKQWPSSISYAFVGDLLTETGLDRCAGYQRATARTKSVWKVTFTAAPAEWAENGLGDLWWYPGKAQQLTFKMTEWFQIHRFSHPSCVPRNSNVLKTPVWFP